MKAVKPPRHIWSGDWWEESDRARQEAEEQAAALREEARRRAEANRPPPPPEPRRFTRKHKILATALVAGTVTVSAFAIGTLVGGGPASSPDPLPAVSDKPLKPPPRPTRAGLLSPHARAARAAARPGARGPHLRAREPGCRLDQDEQRLRHGLPDRLPGPNRHELARG